MDISTSTFLIGIIFTPLAALMASLITYSEALHHFPDKKEPRRLAFQTAIFTLIFFIVLSLIIGLNAYFLL